ncbi:MAG: HAMP domain-containing sensor histidine kinase [Phycisphaerae bacterium]
MNTMTGKLNVTQDDLAGILESYSQAAERLKESHDVLQLEVRRLREELAQKNRQLERRKRLAALGEMAAGLAHEIRNPLGGIQLYANLLRKDLTDRPQLANIVDKMITGVKILDALVTDVLALTHTVQPKFTATDLVPLVNSAIELLAPHMQEKQSQVFFQAPAALAVVCDPNMLQRAILNLIRNAIDAAGISGQVFVEIIETNNQALLQITDTGPGIDPEIADKIFNPFFTTKDTGTGLGLAIVHRIIEVHEGTIRVTRAKTGGALFTIKIPQQPSNAYLQGSA